MSYYNKNNFGKYNNKNKNKSKKKKKFNKILSGFLIALLIMGILSAVVSIFEATSVIDLSSILDRFKKDKTEYVDVNLVPGDAWSEDSSAYGAWCWNDSSEPSATFVLATDEDGDGVYTVRINTAYTSMLFVDLVPDATEPGADWVYKREQTDNLTVPKDENVYYHVYANTWSDNAELLYNVTTVDVTVFLNTNYWGQMQPPVMYCIDKTGVNASEFIEMNQTGSSLYTAVVPAGYTHIIFLEYGEDGVIGEWNDVITQTEDLDIPVNNFVYYLTETNTWSDSAE